MQQRIAVSHASGIVAEAVLEKLSESGVTPDSLVLLDHEFNVGKRLAYGNEHLRLQDQQAFDLSECALLLMTEADELLESNALQSGCLLVSHAIEANTPAVFMDANSVEPDIAYNATRLRLAGPELCCLLPALRALNQLQPLTRINATLLRSAEFHGKAGVDELASQTINLLNARDVVPAVFPQQIAFNVLPDKVQDSLNADLRHNLGNISYYGALQSLNLPIFHGFAASLQLTFAAEVALKDCETRLSELDQVVVKKGCASPISDCNQSFSCVISQLEQASEQPAGIQFWMLTDPMRYGLANNYVNVAEFLLKSFL